MSGGRTLVRLTSMALGLALVLVAIPGSAAAVDWPSYRGGPSQNMSRSGDPGTDPQQVWASVTSVRSEPCVIAAGGSVFTVATLSSDFGAQRLFRIDASSGEVVWSSPTFEAVRDFSCPAVEGSRVIFAHGSHLTALEVSDGSQAWDVILGGLVGIPVVSDGTVYVHSSGEEGTLFARDVDDGGAVWSAGTSLKAGAPLVVAGTVVNVARGSSPALSAFDALSGEAVWSESGPFLDVIGHGDQVVYATGPAVLSRDASDGSLSWSHSVPVFTAARKLVADGSTVYALTPSTDIKFQVNHLIALAAETGEVEYSREFEEVTSCCGTTSAYAPFVKFGPTLYNHYRYFEAATGASPGGAFDRTQTVFYDGKGCSNEQDSMFAHVDRTVYVWKENCSSSQLVARRDALPPVPFGLLSPGDGIATQEVRPGLIWEKAQDSAGGTGLSHYEVTLDGEQLGDEIPSSQTALELDADLSDGAHTWSVDAVDAIGNRRTAGPATFTVDTVPPAPFELVAPADGAGNLTSQPMFSWAPAVDAASGIDRYELWVDDMKRGSTVPGACKEGACSLGPVEIAGGSHTWYVLAYDLAGNVRQSETRSFTVDATPPAAFDLLAPTPGGVAPGQPRFEWEASSDAGAGLSRYELFVDGKKHTDVPAGTEFFVPVKALSGETGDSHTWWVVAVDGAGNRRQAESRTFVLDLKAPGSFSLLDPANHETVGPRPQFTWSPSKDVGPAGLDHYELVLDGEPLAEVPAGTQSFTPSADIGGGTHIWSVAAVDAVGNRRQSDFEDFKVDTTPPGAFDLVEPADEAIVFAQPRFAWEQSIDVGGAGLDRYELVLDGELLAEVPGGTESFTPSEDIAEGSHSWSVRAVDRVGNVRESETRAFTVDVSPPSSFGLLEPADEAITSARPPFSWEESVDAGPAGLDRYELIVDGGKLADVAAGTESFTPGEDLAPGPHTWSVTALDKAGNQESSSARGFIVASPPSASLSVPALVLTDAPVTFEASSSTPPPGGAIVKYEWDLNGDGVFERDTGEVSTTVRSYASVKDLTVMVRVSSNLGTDSTASSPLSVRLAPPPGHLGVTINEGAEFTNKRNVTISPVWPAFALSALVSNDGGFREAEAVPIAVGIKWKLDSAGAERLPKTIYVRFQGENTGPETYQDDIILDLVKPKLLSATVAPSGAMLAVRAADATSGVSALQIASDPGGAKTWRPFKRQVRLPRRRGKVFVRVRDRAGNASAWRRAAAR